MPPKKAAATAEAGDAITGFSARDTKLIAAAFVASTGPDKYDYDLFATLTGNTVGSLKKMWPPVKRKIAEAHPSFGNFIGGGAAAVPAKVCDEEEEGPRTRADNGGKRKAASTESDNEQDTKDADTKAATNGDTKKKAPAKGRKKKADSDEATNGDDEEDKKKAPAKGRKKKADSVEATSGDDEDDKKPAAKRGRKQVKSEETIVDDEDDEMEED